ncbi:hypothetical protein [Streptomyces tailanensis]|uniref:hypothetical protein n=1 Tax=Streptomyces tailanensis TaxID=2569858 RepID=UPI001FED08FA|nr:hypothetical protein [Streptomyces tailanensis]
MLPVKANGTPAFAQYRPAEDGNGWTPWGITLLEINDGRIGTMTNHMDTERLLPLLVLQPSPGSYGGDGWFQTASDRLTICRSSRALRGDMACITASRRARDSRGLPQQYQWTLPHW